MRGTDYGPEITPGARVMDIQTGELGFVHRIEPRCHWGCSESSDAWRPRAAYIIRDARPVKHVSRGATVDSLDWSPGYVEPERLTVVPEWWTGGSVVANGAKPRARVPVFMGSVIRYRQADKDTRWWLMNRPDGGWSSFGYGHPSVASVLGTFAVRVAGFGRDAASLFVRVEPVAP